MEALSQAWFVLIALGVEAATAGIIALAAIEAAWLGLRVFVGWPAVPDAAGEGVRLRLARWLAVALGFALAADVQETRSPAEPPQDAPDHNRGFAWKP